MIRVSLINDCKTTEAVFSEYGVEFNGNCRCMAAADGDEILARCLFEFGNNFVIIKKIVPENDILMADGVLRSTLFVATNHGKSSAFYDSDSLEPLLDKLGFIVSKSDKSIDINKIFESCNGCSGKKE